jgi:hypothetical protein
VQGFEKMISEEYVEKILAPNNSDEFVCAFVESQDLKDFASYTAEETKKIDAIFRRYALAKLRLNNKVRAVEHYLAKLNGFRTVEVKVSLGQDHSGIREEWHADSGKVNDHCDGISAWGFNKEHALRRWAAEAEEAGVYVIDLCKVLSK